ncbi:phosphoribosylanthranilate isomerase [Shimia isoporae]|uniref:N-(5'-phosphoribosyl)anthranilate isomerase n=1 Tax=Shimia isoporae TaxID=647720 RepID=A0A4R1NUM8_9RHOB|nr:phosphoribosylanthranilate isomerase [Shimia isoporae]TCL08752.1 phosphoribosylanthranilate isomerase [Shimia isoporae]
MDIRVKICGLKEPEHVAAAAHAGAAYVGFVFFEKSPRNVSLPRARDLAVDVPVGVAKVALTVNAEDAFLDQLVDTVPLDMLQLHGKETPERVAQVRSRYGLPVMKAIGIAEEADVAQIETYGAVADQLLVDAKAPKGAALPGGNGLSFDWRLVNRKYWPTPWMLAGGLTVDNVAEAIRMTGARQLDLSSGVESAPGIKDPEMIRAFMEAVRSVK